MRGRGDEEEDDDRKNKQRFGGSKMNKQKAIEEFKTAVASLSKPGAAGIAGGAGVKDDGGE
jgi:hypothetical protein